MRAVCLILTTCVLTACGGRPLDDAGKSDAGPPFVATQGDFTGFTSWESFDGGTNARDTLDGGQRTIYLNHRPPHGSEAFPLGTIIVKTTDGAQTFAMAKRGGGFNPVAGDWEWFELSPSPDGTAQIIWRGTGPPSAQTYGDTTAIACDVCHYQEGYQNDDVAGGALLLSSF